MCAIEDNVTDGKVPLLDLISYPEPGRLGSCPSKCETMCYQHDTGHTEESTYSHKGIVGL